MTVAPSADDRPLAIIDIDGVLADVRHRLHHIEQRPKRWGAFFAAAVDDELHPEGAEMVERLSADHEIVFLTGRPEHLADDTATWLEENGLGGHRLVMRPAGDRGPAPQLKVRILRELARGREVAVVVDDDPLVIDAMDAAGYNTLLAEWEPRAARDERALRDAQDVEGRT